MGILVAADIFQEAIGGLFLDLESVIVYTDDIIILGNSSLVDYLPKGRSWSTEKAKQQRYADKQYKVLLVSFGGRLPRLHYYSRRNQASTEEGSRNFRFKTSRQY